MTGIYEAAGTMSDHIELHDSRLVLSLAKDAVILNLCPAYIHHWDRLPSGWRGEGRSQSAEIVIAKGSVASSPLTGVFEISEGWFQVGARLHENMIPVPFEENAPVRGRLDLVNAGAVELSGEGIVVRLVGEPEYVEDLPLERPPSGGAA